MVKEWWRPVVGYEGLYEVSNLGRVRSLNYKGETGKIKLMTQRVSVKYYQVHLSKNGKTKYILVHRLMAEAFLPNPNNLSCVNHKDENKLNNFIWVNDDGTVDLKKSNLEWCTKSYNNNYGTVKERISNSLKGRFINRLDLSKPVIQYTQNWGLIAVYPSVKEAERQTGINKGNISACASQQPIYYKKKKKFYVVKSAGGFIWRYA